MINEDIRHIVEAELREGEELLWADKSDLNVVKRKAFYIYGFTFLLIFGIALVVLFLGEKEPTVFEAVFFLIFISGIAFLVLRKSIRNEINKVKNVYAVTNQVFLIKGASKENTMSFTQRIPFEEIKHVHEMNIAGGKSITLVLKGGLIPNSKSIIIDGLPKDSSLKTIIERKINFL